MTWIESLCAEGRLKAVLHRLRPADLTRLCQLYLRAHLWHAQMQLEMTGEAAGVPVEVDALEGVEIEQSALALVRYLVHGDEQPT